MYAVIYIYINIKSPTHSAVAIHVSVLICGEASRVASLLKACMRCRVF